MRISVVDADYRAINDAWPAELPVITRAVARICSRKLLLHFGGATPLAAGRRLANRLYVRRVWIALTATDNNQWKGWRRMVHDVSHTLFAATHPRSTDHGGLHARLEMEMVQYVIAHGWLTGALHRPGRPRLTVDERRARRRQHADAMLAVWETRLKRAQGKVKKWRAAVRRYQRAAA